jgi:hypothetical protein
VDSASQLHRDNSGLAATVEIERAESKNGESISASAVPQLKLGSD